ncbi:katanin p60 ATPase-containing subunit A-like 2 [Sphaerodactylus townsendi]|nr:katanin p60 ATPase-containing subunit A-like 2 [Sphaerodactylus townsendi]
MELTYQSLKTTYQAKEAEEMRTEARRKNLLILILHYLTEEGYVDTANTLEQETKLGLRRFEVAAYTGKTAPPRTPGYNSHDRKGQVFSNVYDKSKQQADNKGSRGAKIKRAASSTYRNLPKINQPQTAQRPMSKTSSNRIAESKLSSKESPRQENDGVLGPVPSDFGLNVSAIHKGGGGEGPHPRRGQIIDFRGMIQRTINISRKLRSRERLLKPLGAFIGMTGEMRELATVVSRDIYLHNPNVKWKDIIGLDVAKQLVKEAVVYPIRYPQLFTGILSPWKGLLLYGPPGTGKTLLAKAVATECNTTFFNISASTIVSKWRGDSEKLVRVLFELARYHAPSTIFLDELESVMSQRGSSPGGEHEGSLRMKTELLVQMDGLARSDDLVFVLAASNLPWDLDCAMLRRLEKRILVDLPSKEAREAMVQHWLPAVSNSGGVELRTNLDYASLSQEMEGYSGSDVKLVCKEAAMRPVRKIFSALENHHPGMAMLGAYGEKGSAQVGRTSGWVW